MSKFSNKCDLWDWLDMCREPNETIYECYKRLHTELILNDPMTPVVIKKPSDLVKYYPYFDAVHVYARGNIDKHWVCPLECSKEMRPFYGITLDREYEKVAVEEDPKYVQTL